MNSNKERYFFIDCCNQFVLINENDFSYRDVLKYLCYKHNEIHITYLSWKAGIGPDEHREINRKYS